MKKSEYHNVVFFYSEVDSIGKSPDQTAPKITMNLLIEKRVPCYVISDCIEHSEEFFTEPR